MKVDLHLHSFTSLSNGDSIKMLSFLDNMKILKRSNVKAFAFTDHNKFYAKEYISNKAYAKRLGITIFPGVELDVTRKNKELGHVLFIFEDNLSEEKLKELERIINKTLGKHKVSVEELDNKFPGYKTLVIPHVGKGDFLDVEDLKEFKFDAIEVVNDIHLNYKKFQKFWDKKESIVSFSDTHIWHRYPQVRNYYTYLECEDNIDSIKELLKTKKDFRKEF